MESTGLRLERLDVLILGALLGSEHPQPNVRKSVTAIAKELEVDEATVRARLRRWRTSGFLVDFGATVNQAMLGQRACYLRFEVPETSAKPEVIQKVRLIDGVYRIRDYYGSAIAASLFYDDPTSLESRIRLLMAVSGASNPVREEIEIPASRREPNTNDMLILGSIGWSSRKSYQTVAKETGLSVKTVKKRLGMMVEDNMLGMGLFLDYRRLEGVIIADLLVVYEDPQRKKEVDRRLLPVLEHRLIPPAWSMPSFGVFRLLLPNLNHQRELVAKVRTLEGIGSAYLDLLVEDMYVAETFYKLERQMIRKLASKKMLPPRLLELWSKSWKLSTSQLYPRSSAQ